MTMDTQDTLILGYLTTHSYEETAEKFGVSRGTVYRIALANGARKHEARIQEKAADRKARQEETLRSLIDKTATADTLDYLDGLPDESVQLVVTSIPYNLGKRYGDAPGADNLAHVYYLGWMAMVLSECARVIKPGGVIVVQAGSTRDETNTLVPLDILLFDTIKKTGLAFQNRVAWLIPHGLTPKRRLSERHEVALIFSKGEPSVFNPTPARIPQKQPGKKAFKGPNKGKLSGCPYGAWPSNVWAINNIGANHPEKTGHPAQYPVELARRAIMLYTNPGDLVVDPFSGSGTTHEAARRTGRAFSGADLFYADMRAQRMKGIEMDNVTILPGVTDESIAVWAAEAREVTSQPADIDQDDVQQELFAA
jgi:DNA modification methylase